MCERELVFVSERERECVQEIERERVCVSARESEFMCARECVYCVRVSVCVLEGFCVCV